jgi:type I restriction enzyme, S subunit
MEVKPGYKQTEIGVIPEEWEVRTLDSLTTLLTNGFVGTATTAYVENDDGVLYIQGYNVQENAFNFQGIKRVSKAFHARNKKSCLQAGDLLTIQTGDIGVTTVVPPALAGANCHALLISRLRKQESEPGYYCQYFNSERGRIAFKEIETGTTMKHLNGGDMKRLFLPSPPIEEQRAIATTLSDVDALLSGLDRLIAKKRDLKQAAMQQLLTGQTRLPGFKGEWEVRRLGDVVDTDPENLGSDTRRDFRFNYIALEDVDRGFLRSHSEQLFASAPSRARRKLRPHDVLVSTVRPNLQSHLHFKGEAGTWVCSTGFCVVRCREGMTHPGYVYFHLFAGCVNRQIDALLTGSNYPAINSSDVRALEVPFPPLPEQTAIAEVLTSMDEELAALEQRREKTRALKQAMMQELLTGRTRLV